MALHGAACQQPRWTLSDHDNKNRGWFNIKPTSVRGFVIAVGGAGGLGFSLVFIIGHVISSANKTHTRRRNSGGYVVNSDEVNKKCDSFLYQHYCETVFPK